MDSIDVNMVISKCQTGDLLLYSSNNWISYLIEYFTSSQFSHISMIVKDPIYIDSKLKGIYVLE